MAYFCRALQESRRTLQIPGFGVDLCPTSRPLTRLLSLAITANTSKSTWLWHGHRQLDPAATLEFFSHECILIANLHNDGIETGAADGASRPFDFPLICPTSPIDLLSLLSQPAVPWRECWVPSLTRMAVTVLQPAFRTSNTDHVVVLHA